MHLPPAPGSASRVIEGALLHPATRAMRARGLRCLSCRTAIVAGDRLVRPRWALVGSAPVTHLDQELGGFSVKIPAGSLALTVPQKTVGSRPRPSVAWDRSIGSRYRVQPLMARDQGASAGSLEEGRRLPLRSVGCAPDPSLGSAASVHIYPNDRPIWNGKRSRMT